MQYLERFVSVVSITRKRYSSRQLQAKESPNEANLTPNPPTTPHTRLEPTDSHKHLHNAKCQDTSRHKTPTNQNHDQMTMQPHTHPSIATASLTVNDECQITFYVTQRRINARCKHMPPGNKPSLIMQVNTLQKEYNCPFNAPKVTHGSTKLPFTRPPTGPQVPLCLASSWAQKRKQSPLYC